MTFVFQQQNPNNRGKEGKGCLLPKTADESDKRYQERPITHSRDKVLQHQQTWPLCNKGDNALSHALTVSPSARVRVAIFSFLIQLGVKAWGWGSLFCCCAQNLLLFVVHGSTLFMQCNVVLGLEQCCHFYFATFSTTLHGQPCQFLKQVFFEHNSMNQNYCSLMYHVVASFPALPNW